MVAIQGATHQAKIMSALSRASARTGADFDYLLNTAKRESSLNSAAKAKTSSAAGLFQFIEQTWLDMAKRHGREAGIGSLANQIQTDAKGRHFVSDPATKSEILALRHDVEVSSFLAGKLTRESEMQLEKGLGRPVKEGELYIAHFLGAGRATDFIKAAEHTPDANAAALFQAPAKANKTIFFGEGGQPRTVAAVYDLLSKKGGGEGLAIGQTELASRPVAPYRPFNAPLYTTTYTKPSAPSQVGTLSGNLPSLSLLEMSPLLLDVLSALEAGERSKSERQAQTS